MEQSIAWQISLLLILLLAAVYLYVVLNARHQADYAPIQTRAYRLRGRLFAASAALGTGLMIGTLVDLPYSVADQVTDQAVRVDATGHQFYWELSTDTAPAGRPVVFHVTSADANHGFAIYDQSMRLVAQTQAMPGYTNRLVHTFAEPGTYRILCLEYCGIAHHAMDATFTVTDAPLAAR
ncbi:cytochrome C oxidase subunit II [Ectothiorhodospiraceae bacterium 2226]|nr:cytochrome C oxidase subunit II [Ectothiorhodospiraceae bacterium 2226]